MTAMPSFLRAFAAQPKELKYMRLYGKIVCLLNLSLKCVEVVVGYLNALDIFARGAHKVVVMVVRMKKFIALHPVEDVDL